jgi:hypothetical protein
MFAFYCANAGDVCGIGGSTTLAGRWFRYKRRAAMAAGEFEA